MTQPRLYSSSRPHLMLMRLVLWVGLASAPIYALNLTQFIDCVGPNSGSYGSTCTLDPNGGSGVPWLLEEPILVYRNSITVEGNDDYYRGVVLKRNAAYDLDDFRTLMTVSAYGVTIQNLVFDGNNGTYPYSSGDTTTDLEFVYPSWNNYVIESEFNNAPHIAVDVPYYTYFEYCDFNDNFHTGIQTTQPSGHVASIGIGIYDSSFYHTGTGGVYFKGGNSTSIIQDSDFIDNHYTCTYGSGGGQILLDESTSGIWVRHNEINGHDLLCPMPEPQPDEVFAGIETYGDSHVIRDNTVKNHSWFGIYFAGATGISIYGNTIQDNASNGINVSGQASNAPCVGYPGPTFSVHDNTITGNGGWGLYAYKNGCTYGPGVSQENNEFEDPDDNDLGDYSINNP